MKATGFRFWERKLDGFNLGGKIRSGKNWDGKYLVEKRPRGKGLGWKRPGWKRPGRKRTGAGGRPVGKDPGEKT